jgi:hypothetical protein
VSESLEFRTEVVGCGRKQDVLRPLNLNGRSQLIVAAQASDCMTAFEVVGSVQLCQSRLSTLRGSSGRHGRKDDQYEANNRGSRMAFIGFDRPGADLVQ